ncbi:Lanthionine synthetase C family protein [Streptomyces microflavus DSM 40593]|uniref:Lanthionine synthetase C family protein n=1 Tax=Streptomyces microflavus DSM 40593 TaxID=1303692 RepID=N0D0M6_STRMI|nr:Lanthionine synthetase C family protein [Streptomyces microflavus DSM 40593]
MLPWSEAVSGPLDVEKRDSGRAIGEMLPMCLKDGRRRAGVGELRSNGIDQAERWEHGHVGLLVVRAVHARAAARAK